jgi:hypothetical protein
MSPSDDYAGPARLSRRGGNDGELCTERQELESGLQAGLTAPVIDGQFVVRAVADASVLLDARLSASTFHES